MILENKNYRLFLFGRISSNVGDSFFYQLIPLLLLTYNNSSFWISLNGFIIYLPYFIFPLIAYRLDKSKNKNNLLIKFEIINLMLTLIFVIVLLKFHSIIMIIGIAGCYYFVTCAYQNLQNSYFKNLIKEKDIFEFMRIYEFSGKVLDVVLDAIATFVILFIGYMFSLIVNIISFIISILSFSKIKYQLSAKEDEKQVVDKTIKFNDLKRNSNFFVIICSDSILNGFTTMSIIIMPLFLQNLNLLKFYPLVLLSRSMSGVLGIYFSKYLQKYNYVILYGLSYIIYGVSMFLLVNSSSIVLIVLFYFIGFFLNAATEPYYSKAMLDTYEENELSQITAHIQFLLVTSILIVTVISMLITVNASFYFYLASGFALILGLFMICYYVVNKNNSELTK